MIAREYIPRAARSDHRIAQEHRPNWLLIALVCVIAGAIAYATGIHNIIGEIIK